MPACLAHYQFGADVLSRIGKDVQRVVLAFKNEFDVGLQGPDIFFFYKPYLRNGVRTFGIARHSEPGFKMFEPMLEKMYDHASLSYLFGLICHYVLDKGCHPYVISHSALPLDHHRMEAAFDRYMMISAGITEARHHFLPAASLDCKAIAAVWPCMDAKVIQRSVRSERFYIRIIDHRHLLELCETAVRRRGSFTPLTLPDIIPSALTEHMKNLKCLYDTALDECPGLIRTALDAMGKKHISLPGFFPDYKGQVSEQ